MSQQSEYYADMVLNGRGPTSGSRAAALGNLTAGSSDTHLENLVQKWFQGLDRPAILAEHTAMAAYRDVSGSLFQGGHDYSDVDQGALGDCYLLASLASISAMRPFFHIPDMFSTNGDGTWSVRFYDGADKHFVTVDTFLPTTTSGYAIYAGWGGGHRTNAGNELWVALAEKAYVQYNEMNLIGQDGTNTYAGIEGGWPHNSVEHVSSFDGHGMGSLSGDSGTAEDCGINSRPFGVNTSTHAYAIVDYSPTMRMYRVYNPHGHMEYGGGWVTWGVLDNDFTDWWYADGA